MVEGQGINTLQHAVPAPCSSRRKYTKVNSAERKKTDSPVSQNFQWMVAGEWLFPFPLFPVFTSWFGFSSEILHTQGTETLLTVIPLLSDW